MAVTMKDAVFWNVGLCRYFANQHFGGMYRLHVQGIRNPRVMNQHEQVAVDSCTATCSRWFIARGLLIPWRWRRYTPPKRRLTKYLHGATSQKTAFFMYALVHICKLLDEMSKNDKSKDITFSMWSNCVSKSGEVMMLETFWRRQDKKRSTFNVIPYFIL
jgi:hypothetical protein